VSPILIEPLNENLADLVVTLLSLAAPALESEGNGSICSEVGSTRLSLAVGYPKSFRESLLSVTNYPFTN